MNLPKIVIDPEGYTVLVFDSFEERATFIRAHIPSGEAFGLMRCSTQTPYTIAWKHTDLTTPLILGTK